MKKWYKTFAIYVAIIIFVVSMAYVYTGMQKQQEVKEVEFSEFVTELQKENVTSLTLKDTSMTGTLKDKTVIHAYAPSSIQLMSINTEYVMPQVDEGRLVVTSEPPTTTPWYVSMLPYMLTIVVFVIIWIFFMNSAQGGTGKAMSFGKSKARLYKDDGKKITFDDVAGLKEEKEELEEIVDFLRRPKKYQELGARIPKGVLLVGPPGTGKTYVTKAVSGEAGVPFYSISGSDFVEMFVGVGASRVRDLFEQAKKNAPSIIFIDEIDAVGRRRGAGLGGGHDEREQTLNQMLVEMDGFGENQGVIVFAATNRPDVLDPALLRPGRFDRQIVIGLPDVKGREELFKVHAKNKPLAEDINESVLARMTPGFSPADIENILNEAALLTARRGGKVITMDEIEESVTKVMAGPAKKSRVISEKERKLTAYHEAGHAVIMRLQPDADPVQQITIIPRGLAGGMTMFLPKEDRTFDSKKHMEATLVHLLGGRVAESLVMGDISTGASNDIERATKIARDMVTRYGMSERLGAINYSSGNGEVFLGKDFAEKQNYSEETAAVIDEEVKRLMDHAYSEAVRLLKDNMDKLELVAETLLDIETLDAAQFEALFTGEKTREEVVDEIRTTEAEREERIKKQKEAEAKEEAEARAKLEEELRRQASGMPQAPQYPEPGKPISDDEIVFENRLNPEQEKKAEEPQEKLPDSGAGESAETQEQESGKENGDDK